jgi:hypothetical protein
VSTNLISLISIPWQAVEKGSPASLHSSDSLQRTEAYASAHRTSRALHLRLFEQPVVGSC